MNTDPEWLRRMAERENGGIVSVGGLVSEMETDRDVSPLQWLRALLTELRDTDWPAAQEDPEACYTALRESEALAGILVRLAAIVGEGR